MIDVNIALILALIGSIWASSSSLIAVTKLLNDTRNIILIGKVGNDTIPLRLRKHMFHYDWLPAWILGTLVILAFGFMTLLFPVLVELTKRSAILWIGCLIIFLFPFSATVSSLISGYKDYRYISEELSRAEKNEQKN